MRPALRLDTLPVELFAVIAGFLLGIDLMSLSHVNHALLTELLAPDGDVWMQRAAGLSPQLDGVSAKQRYFQTRTFRFPGLQRGVRGQQRNCLGFAPSLRLPGRDQWREGRQRGGHAGAAPFRFTLESIIGRSSFSFGLWFALLPGESHTHVGGILLGAQSTPIESYSAVTKQAQLIHVNPDGNLYCSVTTTKAVVAKNLETERWYHLVLTFEKPSPGAFQGIESVYLDGERIHTSAGQLNPHRRSMPFWQIGSGHMGNEDGGPHPEYYGWYGFNGMIDDFIVWNRALPAEEIRELKRGGEVPESGYLCFCFHSDNGPFTTHSRFRFDELPAEVFTSVTDFLVGCDFLTLSHVNRVLFNDLLAPNSDMWKQRLLAAEAMDVASAKYWYCSRRALQFPDNGGALNIPYNVPRGCRESSFSISLWFAMDPPLADAFELSVGGILLGAQCSRWTNPRWPHSHEQFIHIDPHGNLYCSVTDSKEIVASNLETGRWYHLVLTFTRHAVRKHTTRCVYLNGEQVHSSSRPLHSQWRKVDCWQLGIGCISGGSPGEPSRNYNGWYGFRGMVDDFCVRDRVLAPVEIKGLSRGSRARNSDVVWSQRQAQAQPKPYSMKNVSRIGYTCSCGGDGCCVSTVDDWELGLEARKGLGRFRRFWRSAEAS